MQLRIYVYRSMVESILSSEFSSFVSYCMYTEEHGVVWVVYSLSVVGTVELNERVATTDFSIQSYFSSKKIARA